MTSPRRHPGLGVLLLSAQLLNVGIDRVPPVTLATIGAMVVLFLRIIHVPWTLSDVCLSARSVLDTWDIKRMTISTFEHADDMHLYYNMVSFLWKGMSLENRFTSQWFAFLLIVFAFLINVVYIILAFVVSNLLGDMSYLDQCAVGFSGVVFALKVLTTHYMPYGMSSVAGILIPRRWAVWFELVLIQILVPNVSGLGHLAGILVGLAYVHGPLRRILNILGSQLFS